MVFFAFFNKFYSKVSPKNQTRKWLTLIKSDTFTKRKNRMTFVGSYTFAGTKKKKKPSLLLIQPSRNIIITCLSFT